SVTTPRAARSIHPRWWWGTARRRRTRSAPRLRGSAPSSPTDPVRSAHRDTERRPSPADTPYKLDRVVKRTEPRSSRGRAEQAVRTRARMVDAALQTLIEEGYAGTSARVIAARGTFNPALVFYHYGGVDELLLAALDASSEERMARYRDAMSQPG